MKIRDKIFFCFLGALLTTVSLQAANWKRIGTADGLSSTQTRQIVCLPNGQMMAVLEGNINLYDGQQFQSLEIDRRLTTEVHSFLNTNHYFDRQGRLWIRSLHQLTAIDARSLQQLDVRRLLHEAGVTGRLQNFFLDDDGTAWMHVGEDSLMCYDWQAGQARLVMRITEMNPDTLRASVCDVVGCDGMDYFLFSNGRMMCYDKRLDNILYTLSLGDANRGYYLRAWMLSKSKLVVRMYSGDENQLVEFDTQRRLVSRVLLHEGVANLWCSPDGEVWTCNKHQVWHFDARLRLKESFDDAPIDLQSLTLDQQGGIWACTHNSGLVYRVSHTSHIPYYSLPGKVSVNCFAPLPDRRLLVGSSHGLFCGDGNDGWQQVEGTAGWLVTNIDQGAHGNFYVSTRNCGLFELDSALHVRWAIDDRIDTKMRNNVDFCYELPDGRRIFNCRLNRLIVIDPQTRRLDHLMERLDNVVQNYRRIVDALHLSDGWLMASQNGLFFLKTIDGKQNDFQVDMQRFALLNDNPWSIKCNCLFRDREGRILVGTQNGLLCFDERRQELRRFAVTDGLPDNCIQSITDDRSGHLWLATMKGLCRLNTVSGETDGVGDYTFVERAATRTPDGRLFFGTEHGLYAFHPDSLKLPQLTLRPRLLALHIAGIEGFLAGSEDIRLPYDQNFITFTVSALNYAYASHTRYRHRLRGIDPDWVETTGSGSNLKIPYTALPPGHYRLEVQAAMQGETWGETLTVKLTIRPPLWRTWWAYLLYAMLAVTLFYYLRRSYIERRNMRRRIDELIRERHVATQPVSESDEPLIVEEETIEAADAAEPEDADEEKLDSAPPRTLTQADRRFLEKALNCIDRNMANTEYSIDAFASEMAMERSTLYRRLQAVMGQAPLEFVRTIRLKKAAELLRSGKYNVTEVSELVGFNTPRYFTKHFRDMYGVRPSEYK